MASGRGRKMRSKTGNSGFFMPRSTCVVTQTSVLPASTTPMDQVHNYALQVLVRFYELWLSGWRDIHPWKWTVNCTCWGDIFCVFFWMELIPSVFWTLSAPVNHIKGPMFKFSKNEKSSQKMLTALWIILYQGLVPGKNIISGEKNTEKITEHPKTSSESRTQRIINLGLIKKI